MNVQTLTDIGLNKTQARAYISLVKSGSLSPPDLAKKIGESRTNSYAVLDQLVDLKLAIKTDVNKKNIYKAGNPIALEKLARDKRKAAHENEKIVQASMPTLLNYFHSFSDQPGVKFYQGVEGIKEIYNDILLTCKDVYLFRSPKDQDVMSLKFFIDYKEKRAKLGIKTYILNSSADSTSWNEVSDKRFNLVRSQIPVDSYTSPVEISSYGDKVSIISFGEEVMGMIINSPQIADSIRQIFNLCKNSSEINK